MHTSALRTFLRRISVRAHAEAGSVATEYGLLLLLIALAIVLAATAFGASVAGLFDQGTAGFPGGS
jgi:Flp pilus assembly pilin Flp